MRPSRFASPRESASAAAAATSAAVDSGPTQARTSSASSAASMWPSPFASAASNWRFVEKKSVHCQIGATVTSAPTGRYARSSSSRRYVTAPAPRWPVMTMASSTPVPSARASFRFAVAPPMAGANCVAFGARRPTSQPPGEIWPHSLLKVRRTDAPPAASTLALELPVTVARSTAPFSSSLAASIWPRSAVDRLQLRSSGGGARVPIVLEATRAAVVRARIARAIGAFELAHVHIISDALAVQVPREPPADSAPRRCPGPPRRSTASGISTRRSGRNMPG